MMLPAGAGLLSVAGGARPVAALLLAYLALVGLIAVTAVYSSRPARRRAAVVVLHLLLPRRDPARRARRPAAASPGPPSPAGPVGRGADLDKRPERALAGPASRRYRSPRPGCAVSSWRIASSGSAG
jgi:hypothetical protein